LIENHPSTATDAREKNKKTRRARHDNQPVNQLTQFIELFKKTSGDRDFFGCARGRGRPGGAGRLQGRGGWRLWEFETRNGGLRNGEAKPPGTDGGRKS
jgi:hypothetical protein